MSNSSVRCDNRAGRFEERTVDLGVFVGMGTRTAASPRILNDSFVTDPNKSQQS